MMSKCPQVRHRSCWSRRGVKISTDQKVGGSRPSERATVSPVRRPGHLSSGSSFSSSGRILAVPASVSRPSSRRSAYLSMSPGWGSMAKTAEEAEAEIAHLNQTFGQVSLG